MRCKGIRHMDKTLLKGLTVLEAISRLDGATPTLDQIAEEIGLTRSNTHRTLQTLAHAGYVRRDPATGSYQCTLKLFELGARQLASLDARKLAPPFMDELARLTNETVHLSVLDGLDVVYVDKLDSPQPLLAYSTVGGRAPAYAVATGKALLACQTADYLDHYGAAIKRHTEDTHVSLLALKQELADVNRIGYAINRGEWRQGIGGIAAPIFNGLDKAVAALGISGPLERLTNQKMREYAPLVQQAARQLSAHMGYRGGYFGGAA
ncbi:IclR family transcriptional regulator [Bordetella pertussis]|uniref:IclR-family transcriptional regulator n=4 Tax=Bordetella pertussis TaxID=520 RepID=Q7VU21_BORPE|nr:IclR family transcriptional regulator [Bordetella pertussis]AEE68473.1 IclR family transcriptional regulator [Bordetella pertussis CS]AIW91044.1 IclR family transcriptional regulator [Bordetella pertussis B1917]AIW97027.1 IclR family transcriptional regulator [Bordetella pertussis B1920]ALH48094.1 IclR family transcriptional regulator [Bordetella pertussis]ALH51557.1 IclR family transcriptional regulator [Bordetella pertussis]